MEVLLIGIVTAINIIVVKMKFERGRWEDGSLDLTLLVIITLVFGGSYAGLVVGTVASMVISIYLYASPPTFTKAIAEAFKEEDTSPLNTRTPSQIEELFKKS
jgi:hypothetical protein